MTGVAHRNAFPISDRIPIAADSLPLPPAPPSLLLLAPPLCLNIWHWNRLLHASQVSRSWSCIRGNFFPYFRPNPGRCRFTPTTIHTTLSPAIGTPLRLGIWHRSRLLHALQVPQVLGGIVWVERRW